jgi:addiction module HigA family antidote
MLPVDCPPTHPGEALAEDFLGPLEISEEEIAERTKLSLRYIRELIAGEADCTVDAAIRLANELHTRPEFWLSLQVRCDMWHMQDRDVAN